MIIMQINIRTACTTTRRTGVKRGNAAAVWSSSNTSSTVSRPRSPTTRRRPTCSYYSLLSAASSTRGGATSPQRLWSTWRTGWQGSEAPSRDCNTRETRSRLLWTLDQLLSHRRRLEHQPALGETPSFQSRCTRASARSRSTGRTASPPCPACAETTSGRATIGTTGPWTRGQSAVLGGLTTTSPTTTLPQRWSCNNPRQRR